MGGWELGRGGGIVQQLNGDGSAVDGCAAVSVGCEAGGCGGFGGTDSGSACGRREVWCQCVLVHETFCALRCRSVRRWAVGVRLRLGMLESGLDPVSGSV
eukprot:357763-Chlamydomonas_euryale.AAC.4